MLNKVGKFDDKIYLSSLTLLTRIRMLVAGILDKKAKIMVASCCSVIRTAITAMRPSHQYVIQQRVERAKQVLKQGKTSVCKVATLMASPSTSHFNRHFRRLTGVKQQKKNVKRSTLKLG